MFYSSVESVVGPRLLAQGFRSVAPGLYARRVACSLHVVEFMLTDDDRFAVLVLVKDCREIKSARSLPKLVRDSGKRISKYGVDVGHWFWDFDSNGGLENALADAWNHFQHYGLPWLGSFASDEASQDAGEGNGAPGKWLSDFPDSADLVRGAMECLPVRRRDVDVLLRECGALLDAELKSEGYLYDQRLTRFVRRRGDVFDVVTLWLPENRLFVLVDCRAWSASIGGGVDAQPPAQLNDNIFGRYIGSAGLDGGYVGWLVGRPQHTEASMEQVGRIFREFAQPWLNAQHSAKDIIRCARPSRKGDTALATASARVAREIASPPFSIDDMMAALAKHYAVNPVADSWRVSRDQVGVFVGVVRAEQEGLFYLLVRPEGGGGLGEGYLDELGNRHNRQFVWMLHWFKSPDDAARTVMDAVMAFG